VDRLVGLKENVIIGRLIPAGTGFKGSKKHALVEAMEAEFAAMQPAVSSESEGETR
jgi:DNA-directed RNA polymerase subunit beta'